MEKERSASTILCLPPSGLVTSAVGEFSFSRPRSFRCVPVTDPARSALACEESNCGPVLDALCVQLGHVTSQSAQDSLIRWLLLPLWLWWPALIPGIFWPLCAGGRISLRIHHNGKSTAFFLILALKSAIRQISQHTVLLPVACSSFRAVSRLLPNCHCRRECWHLTVFTVERLPEVLSRWQAVVFTGLCDSPPFHGVLSAILAPGAELFRITCISTTLRALSASVARPFTPAKCSHRCEKVAVARSNIIFTLLIRVKAPEQPPNWINISTQHSFPHHTASIR
jgi:hypothetical protein